MYYLGEGVQRDPARAYYWLILARAQEPKAARYYLEKLEDIVPEADKAKARAAARAFKPH